MKRGRLIVAGILLLLIAGAAIFYFAAIPGMLAGDYRDSARPEHEKAEEALEDVYKTFSPERFGVVDKSIERAKTPEAYVDAVRRFAKREQRQLRPAGRAADRARRVLAELDEEALFEPPSWPALGGSGKLADADELAERERRYVASARRFLKRYGRLVDYELDSIAFIRRAGTTIGEVFADVPENPGSPEAVAAPIDSMADRIERIVAKFRKQKAPPGERSTHRDVVGAFTFFASKLHSFSDAVRARDIAKVEAFDDELTRGLRRYNLGDSSGLRRLLTGSTYAKSIRRLEKQATDIEERYERL